MAKQLSDNVTLCTHFDELDTLASEWQELHCRSQHSSPFLDFAYVKHWYRSFAQPTDVRVFRVVDKSRAVGFLPLVLRKKCLVRYLCSLTNNHCFHGDPLVLDGSEEYFARHILRSMSGDRSWDVFHHDFTYSFSPLPGLFPLALLRSEKVLWERETIPTYLVRLDKPFQDYFRNDVSSNARKNHQKCINRLAASGDFEFIQYEGEDAVAFWPLFLELEDSGWKGDRKSSIVKLSDNFTSYYKSLVRFLADNGSLQMFSLNLNGKPIAGVFGYKFGKIYHWAKTGYNEIYGQYSPSNVLLLKIIDHLTEKQPEIEKFHMFPWDYNYKHRYSNVDAECNSLYVFNKTEYGLSSYVLWSAKKIFRKYKRRLCRHYSKL